MNPLLEEMPEEDRDTLIKAYGDSILPQDVITEYFMRRNWAMEVDGHFSRLSSHWAIALLRHLGYTPKKKKVPGRKQQIQWENIDFDTPIICQNNDYPIPVVGLFKGSRSGVISVKTPYMPQVMEFYAKHTRLADENDDLSCLEDMEEIKQIRGTTRGPVDRVFEAEERRDRRRQEREARAQLPKAVGEFNEEEYGDDVYDDETPTPTTRRGKIQNRQAPEVNRTAPPEAAGGGEESTSEVEDFVDSLDGNEADEFGEKPYPWSDLHCGHEVVAEDGDLDFTGVIERTDETGVYIRGGFVQEDGSTSEETVKKFHRRDVYEKEEDVVVVSK